MKRLSVSPGRSLSRYWLPLLVLTAGLILTFGFWTSARAAYQREFMGYFDYRSRDALTRMEVRLRHYEQALLATRGHFQASESVGRRNFATFVGGLDVGAHYPGIQGIGYSVLVPAAGKERHLSQIRSQGFPEYRIHPAGDRELYTSIIYLEPFRERNLRAFGYDMFSEPVRREAMSRARDSGRTTMSGKVKLVQETETDVQSGFLVYVPVYRNGRGTGAVEARRGNLVGWVYAPFRMNDLMRGVLGEGEADLDIEIYDGPEPGSDSLMYDQDACLYGGTPPPIHSKFSLSFGGRTWTVVTRVLPGLSDRVGRDASKGVVFLGSLVSLLLGLLAFFILEHAKKVQQANALLEQRVEARTRELGESASHLRTLIDTIPDLVWMKDLQGVYLGCNSRFERFFGASEQEIVGKTDLDFVDGELADLFRKNDRNVIATGKPILNEEEITFAEDGHRELLETIKTPIFGSHGEVLGVLGIGRDITQRKQIERAHLELERRILQRQRVESLGVLAGGLAHDFNNILTTILGNTEVALYRLDPADPLRKNIQGIQISGRRARDLVQKILLFSRQVETTREPVVVALAVEETVRLLGPAIPPTITLRVEVETAGATVLMDPAALNQVLMNLCVNALHAMGASLEGTLSLSARRLSLDGIDWIEIVVGDTGSGIPPEIRGRIFDPFFTTKAVDEGKGLGLSMVHGIVQRAGGSVEVESEVGSGSRFHVRLPEGCPSGSSPET